VNRREESMGKRCFPKAEFDAIMDFNSRCDSGIRCSVFARTESEAISAVDRRDCFVACGSSQ